MRAFSHALVQDAVTSLLAHTGHLNADQTALLLDACHFGDEAHIKDVRKSGEPYITHPIMVAQILADFGLDLDTLIAGILHDTVEDTSVTLDDLKARYNETVALLVDGATKLKSSKMDKAQSKAATFHKILSNTLKDPRVLMIKLADRLHNMSTMVAVRPEKQRKTARETLDFYVPFAHLLGLVDIADQIELLCYRNLDPDMYTRFGDKLLQHGLGRALKQAHYLEVFDALLQDKQLHGIILVKDNQTQMCRTFFRGRGQIDEILRAYAFEVWMDDVPSCIDFAQGLKDAYAIDTFANHIEKPNAGGNQSLILSFGTQKDAITVTIMTRQMKEAARLGILGHSQNSLSRSVIGASVRNLQDLANAGDDDYSTSGLLDYLNESKILCHSPRGDVYELPRGATALDFAYAVGPVIGNRACGAIINQADAPLGLELKNGDLVHIQTQDAQAPRAEWLGVVHTAKARQGILKALKSLPKSKRQEAGKQALNRALMTHQKTLEDLSEQDLQKLIAWRGTKSMDAVFLEMAEGALLPQLVVSRLLGQDGDKTNLVEGTAGVLITRAQCCHPIYGDPIVGHMSKTGLVMHRHKCFSVTNIKKHHPYQIITLNWRNDYDHISPDTRFDAYLQIQMPLSQEQISALVFLLREHSIGATLIRTQGANTYLALVVRGRCHLQEGVRALRALLGYPNIKRLYQKPLPLEDDRGQVKAIHINHKESL